MTKIQPKDLINIIIDFAFEHGRIQGQCDLEESMDNNFFDAFLSSEIASRRGGLCTHFVAGGSRPVRYLLRSEEWREGTKRESKKRIEKLNEIGQKLILSKSPEDLLSILNSL